MTSKRITHLHIYPSPLINESRIMKEVQSLLTHGVVDEVILVGKRSEGLAQEELLGPHQRVIRVAAPTWRPRGLLGFLISYLTFQARVVRRLRGQRWNLTTCHSLSVLGIGVYFKLTRGIPLIYDAHELETEVHGATGIKRVIGKALERGYMPAVDYLIVVSDAIRQWYVHHYAIRRIAVVRNVPLKRPVVVESALLREAFGIPADELVFIYQGLLSPARGVDTILRAFRQLPGHYHVVFMGGGEMVQQIAEESRNVTNIHYLEAVPPDDVHRFTASADVGLHLIRNTCLNHYFCAPNKVFEYLMSGIPQIISDFPEMRRVLDNGRCGWAIEPEVEALVATVLKLDKSVISEKKSNVLEVRMRWGWEFEEQRLLLAYQTVLGKRV